MRPAFIFLISLTLFVAAKAKAADITLRPNGPQVTINGSSVVCLWGPGTTSLSNVSDSSVVEMAIAGRLGACTVEKDSSGFDDVFITTNGISHMVIHHDVDIDVAPAIRDFYSSGACN